jgi:hypothetical protein
MGKFLRRFGNRSGKRVVDFHDDLLFESEGVIMDGSMFNGVDTVLVVLFWLAVVGVIAILGGIGWFAWWAIHHIFIAVV